MSKHLFCDYPWSKITSANHRKIPYITVVAVNLLWYFGGNYDYHENFCKGRLTCKLNAFA